MRKILALAIMLLSGISGFSQIKMLEVTHLERLGRVGTNDVYVQKEGNLYTFYYKNIETPEAYMRNFTFKNLDGDYDGLYKIIMDGFNANPLNDLKLELPNDYVWLHYTRTATKITVQFMTNNKTTGLTGLSVPLSVDDIKKLFEKA